eukprot:CAMPEP_0197852386 /NCGR_PEP_ID=MMETSP1438-20131217/20461_1 /TAXON_ID=1461541 /ORGANISM="Pterosperma sp., Strain CCMP1384" /LENGTH=507 /DNA_ID=CAMNT_0043466419 /DNA_START=83 /DNA_END=1603 /DNA_ORIENTATION=+
MEAKQVEGLRRQVAKSRSVVFAVLATAALFCLVTFSSVVVLTEQLKEVTVIEGALSEVSSSEPVTTRDFEGRIPTSLSDETAKAVQYLNVQAADGSSSRHKVEAFHRVHKSSLSTQLPANEDGYHYFFITNGGSYAAVQSGDRTTFTQVELPEDVYSPHHCHHRGHRDLLTTGAEVVSEVQAAEENMLIAGEASGDAANVAALTHMFGDTFTHSRVFAAVDHLYGIASLDCPEDTLQFNELGEDMNSPVCGNYAETKICGGVTAGFYDLDFSGRCLDLCFYFSPTEICGDGYWTCVPHGINQIPDAAGVHDTKFFCEPDAICAFPRCADGEGGTVPERWFSAVEVVDNEVVFNVGSELFNKAFASCGLVEYIFDSVPYAYYSRETPVPISVSPYDLFTTNWMNTGNNMHTDFELYSTLGELRTGNVTWDYCSYVNPGDLALGFPGNCGPLEQTLYKWFMLPDGEMMNEMNGQMNSADYGFKIYVGQDLPCGLWGKITGAPSPPPPSP